MEAILDQSKPFDLNLFDRVVRALYVPNSPQEQQQANEVLMKYQDLENSWINSPTIVDNSSLIESKFVALNTLDKHIKKKWKMIEPSDRDSIKSYIVTKILQISSNLETFYTQESQSILRALNKPLISILKHDWVSTWTDFVQEMVQSARNSFSICENNLTLLGQLCEEVFDFGDDWMTAQKKTRFKEQYTKDFGLVFELIQLVFGNTQNSPESLVLTALRTLSIFIPWIDHTFIFDSDLIQSLVTILLPPLVSRNDTLMCLTQIAGLELGEKENECSTVLLQLYNATAISILEFIPQNVDIPNIYMTSSEQDRTFLRTVALFLTTFHKSHTQLLENSQSSHMYIIPSLRLVSRISLIQDKDVFQICLDFWHFFAQDLYKNDIQPAILPSTALNDVNTPIKLNPAVTRQFVSPFAPRNSEFSSTKPQITGTKPTLQVNFANTPKRKSGILGKGASQQASEIATKIYNNTEKTPRIRMYSEIIAQVRMILVSRMAKPEEILVSVNEAGDIVRQSNVDSDQIELYKQMRETLIYISHLNPAAMKNSLLDTLNEQMNPASFNYDILNSLCWAIGAISGTLSKEEESQFVIKVLHQLLQMVNTKDEREPRAVIATNVMFVASQYPRFLKNNWKFQRTVLNKLIQFMKEPFPGVKDMATETFLKICRSCKRSIVMERQDDTHPIQFVDEVLHSLNDIVSDLERNQILNVYESVATIISGEKDDERRIRLLEKLFETPNQHSSDLINKAHTNEQILFEGDPLATLYLTFSIFARTIEPLKMSFLPEFVLLFGDCCNLYSSYSNFLHQVALKNGPSGLEDIQSRAVNLVRTEIMNMMINFFNVCNDPHTISQQFLEPVIVTILPCYPQSHQSARDPRILTLLTSLTTQLRSLLNPHFILILQSVFEPTLSMITNNFEDFPEHRLAFYTLFRALNADCPSGFPSIVDPDQMKIVVDSILWGIKHADANIADIALDLLHTFIENMASSNKKESFFNVYYVRIFCDVIGVMTDSFHKQGFRRQCLVLHTMSRLLTQNVIRQSFSPDASITNEQFVVNILLSTISTAFPHLLPIQIDSFIKLLFSNVSLDQLVEGIRNFLVQIQEFAKDESDLYLDDYLDKKHAEMETKLKADFYIPGLINFFDFDNYEDE
ncbi:putative exportin 1B [Blattamonas nauphoetae]|uniref:Exportin 1B n=1 Tax=Blattamonas nauphoetae TaxID=2049346 RepID=A0ABQ9XYH4_9EUKA|nr:putative exportin 1B [Blattamonas nauphoetae]